MKKVLQKSKLIVPLQYQIKTIADMRTNFQMVREFTDYMPAKRGFTSNEEMNRIAEHFHLAEMTALELQNLRDFVVMWYRNDSMSDKFEAMLSITAVIDHYKYAC